MIRRSSECAASIGAIRMAGRARPARPAAIMASRPLAVLLVTRSNLGDVRGDVGLDLASGPHHRADEEALVLGVLPDVFAVAHRGVEDVALAVEPGPGLG